MARFWGPFLSPRNPLDWNICFDSMHGWSGKEVAGASPNGLCMSVSFVVMCSCSIRLKTSGASASKVLSENDRHVHKNTPCSLTGSFCGHLADGKPTGDGDSSTLAKLQNVFHPENQWLSPLTLIHKHTHKPNSVLSVSDSNPSPIVSEVARLQVRLLRILLCTVFLSRLHSGPELEAQVNGMVDGKWNGCIDDCSKKPFQFEVSITLYIYWRPLLSGF